MKKILIPVLWVLVTLTLVLRPAVAAAQDDAMPVFFRDTLMGAGIGAFVGALVLLTSDNKSDHWDYVAFGGLAGALGGLAYSVGSSHHAFVEMDRDRVTVGLPSLRAETSGVVADLLEYRY